MLTSRRTNPERRVYRSRVQLVVGVIWVLFINAVAIGKIVSKPDQPSTVIVAALFSVTFTLLGGRAAWAGIFTSDQGIHVANVFSSFNLQWQEIDRFEIGRWKLLPYVCLIYTTDGQVKHAFGIEESTNFPNGSAKQMVTELNQELARRIAVKREVAAVTKGPGAAQSELFRESG
jgi:hypothetical protein